MSKADKWYKIFMVSMIVAMAGMLIATGIIAIQKSMKLKASFDFITGVDVEIYVNEENEEGLIFSNYENGLKGIYVNATYCSLSATNLTFNNAFVTAYGNNFTLIVKNYSSFTIQTEITSTATAIVGGNSVNAVEPEITPATAEIEANKSGQFVVTCEPVVPQEITLALQFEEVGPPPYTIKTYGVDLILGTDTITTATGYNGYKYIEFNEVKEWTHDEGYTIPLRWVIIGAGVNQKDLLPDWRSQQIRKSR